MQTDKQAYTVAEVAALTGFSRRLITRLFECETGVLILLRPETLHKRSYRSIRIPRPVYERVIEKLAVR
jgi:transcriptional regulator GlxA family with amidase domain